MIPGAPDLSREVPRSPFEELGGIPWLPRLIDKARAMYSGTLADYAPYPCPTDRVLLACIGLDAGQLGERIRSGATDEEILAFARERMGRRSGIALFRMLVLAPPPIPVLRWIIRAMTPATRRRVLAKNPHIHPRHLECLGSLLALDENHPVPTQPGGPDSR